MSQNNSNSYDSTVYDIASDEDTNDAHHEVITLDDTVVQKTPAKPKLDTTVTLSSDDSESDSNFSLRLAPDSPLLIRTPSPVTQSPPGSAEKTAVKKTKKKITRNTPVAERRRLKAQQKEEERLIKEANRANAANKALDNCTANIDQRVPALIGDPEEISLRTFFDESMARYRPTEYPKLDNSISFTYKRVEVVDGACVSKFDESKWVMIIMEGKEYLNRLLAYKTDESDPKSIKNYLTDVRHRSKCNIVLLIYNLAGHLKSERSKADKNYRRAFKDCFEGATRDTGPPQDDTTSAVLSIGETDLQELRLMLELELKRKHPDWKFHLEFYEKTVDIVQAVVRYTLSIAQFAPKQKVLSSTGLDWAINMDKERAVDPTKSRNDLTQLWINQLQQFSQITLPIAKAIAAEYPSPCALLDQYRNLSVKEGEELLAELYVQRNLKRHIGSNISKKIHCFMTCKEPSVHIGLS